MEWDGTIVMNTSGTGSHGFGVIGRLWKHLGTPRCVGGI